MRLERLQKLLQDGVAFDTETHRIRAGLLSPPLVCGSLGWHDESCVRAPAKLLDEQGTMAAFAEIMRDPKYTLGGANVSFDLLVLAVRFARSGIDIMPEIFAALMDHERIFDVQIAEALDAVAEGCLNKDPRSGGDLINPETGRRGRYSLAMVVDLVLGRRDAKENDEWRQHYEALHPFPIASWPEVARVYPCDDASNTADVMFAQAGHIPRAGVHRWGTSNTCEWCGVHSRDTVGEKGDIIPCRVVRRSRNIHDLSNQVGTAFAMAAGAGWGFRVDQASVDLVREDALFGREEAAKPFVAAGMIRADGSKDTSKIAERVALAYGADPNQKCEVCCGARKVPSPKAKPVRCPDCRGWTVPKHSKCADCAGSGNDEGAGGPCDTCGGTGRQVTIALAECKRCDATGKVLDPKALINCSHCGATGLDLNVAPNIPLTPTGRVAAGRDPMDEAGDDLLTEFADFERLAKVLTTYTPYLRRGRAPIAGHAALCPLRSNEKEDCTCEGPWRDIPLTLWPNVLLETGRASYGGVIQQFPRLPGHVRKRDGEPDVYIPSLRECVVARPGCVFASVDFEAGELVTDAQSLIWASRFTTAGLGNSELANALNAGIKVHNALGASMIGMDYADFNKHVKEKHCKDARQAAKPGNFGFPGGMGPVKMVQTQRRQGPDTPCETGPTWVTADDGSRVRGYRGLRFCILMDGATSCGETKRYMWNDRPIDPTCAHCIECAQRLKNTWLQQWPEHRPYFEFVNNCVENGMLITGDMLDMWPWLQGVYAPGTQLAPGEIMQWHSGRIRGGSDYCGIANGFFQGLLSDISKLALRRASRECYDKTVRVDGVQSPLYGSRIIVFQHDEIIAEIPEAVAHDAATRLSVVMVDAMREVCPDMKPACKAEPALMRLWSKNASACFDADSRLIPWQPKY